MLQRISIRLWRLSTVSVHLRSFRSSFTLCSKFVECARNNGGFLTYECRTTGFNSFNFCSRGGKVTGPLTPVIYEQVCNETLDSLSEYIEELTEKATHLNDADVSYSDGVLTVKFGTPYGTYVINRQTPNLQIWLSSPISGPKRYDFQEGCWVYRHDGMSLHQLLNKEIPDIVKMDVDFSHCSYGGNNHDNK